MMRDPCACLDHLESGHDLDNSRMDSSHNDGSWWDQEFRNWALNQTSLGKSCDSARGL